MKYILIIALLLCQPGPSFGQEKNIKTKYYHFEFGLSAVYMLERQKEQQKPEYFQMPNFVKFTWTPIKNFAFAADYHMSGSHYNLKGTESKNTLTGYNRMHVFTASVGNNFHFFRDRLIITPSLLIAARPEGWEQLKEVIPTPWPNNKWYIESYKYKSFGMGFGLSSCVVIKTLITVGIECRYNYFNEKPVQLKEVGIENYKLNESFLTGILKIGFRLGVDD